MLKIQITFFQVKIREETRIVELLLDGLEKKL